MLLSNSLVIAPISHARIQTGQTASRTLSSFFGPLAKLVKAPTNDVDLVMTRGLYQHSGVPRIESLLKEAEWRNAFNNNLAVYTKSEKYRESYVIPKAFALVDWDLNITENWDKFLNYFQRLQKLYTLNEEFKGAIDRDLQSLKRTPTDGNLSFIFEETAVTALWLKGLITTKERIRKPGINEYTNIVYPGQPMPSMMLGLQMLLKGDKNIAPLRWINAQSDEPVISNFHFGIQSSRPVAQVFINSPVAS